MLKIWSALQTLAVIAAADDPVIPLTSEPTTSAFADADAAPKVQSEAAKIFFSKDITGDVSKPVSEIGTCYVTGKAPYTYHNVFPPFCLSKPQIPTNRCCAGVHDTEVRQNYEDMTKWPWQC